MRNVEFKQKTQLKNKVNIKTIDSKPKNMQELFLSFQFKTGLNENNTLKIHILNMENNEAF